MQSGIASIQRLLEEAAVHSPSHIRIVATGAVREAANGKDFAERILETTGHAPTILSGEEEASGIAAGLATDPSLAHHHDFLACDLGGGSLELVLVVARSVKATTSLPLGAVRLTERFIPNPQHPIPKTETEAIAAHIRETLAKSGFPFPETSAMLVGTGGSFATARAVLAEREGIPFALRPQFERQDLVQLLEEISSLSLAERRAHFPAFPPNRVDIMPAALACMVAVVDHMHAQEILNSLFNLRYGIAAELLAKSG